MLTLPRRHDSKPDWLLTQSPRSGIVYDRSRRHEAREAKLF